MHLLSSYNPMFRIRIFIIVYLSTLSLLTIIASAASVPFESSKNTSSEEDLISRHGGSAGRERNLYQIPLLPNNQFYPGNFMMPGPGSGFLNPQAGLGSTGSGTKVDKQGGNGKRKSKRPASADIDDLDRDEQAGELMKNNKQLDKKKVELQDNPKSKTADGEDKDSEARACPACVGNGCNTNTSISGLPLIQILGAIKAGVIWALLFLFIYKNFIGNGQEETITEGYGYAPAPVYGAPQSSYGVPQQTYGAPASQHGTPTTYYTNRIGKQMNYDAIGNIVLTAIDKFSKVYEGSKGKKSSF